MGELGQISDDIKSYFSHQNSENRRKQQRIMILKAEKTTLLAQLIALQRRISDLEMQVGTDDIKFK